MASDGLLNIKALVYSSTAAELLWDREGSEIVQISYNGQVVATLDADSYFTDDLNPGVFHQFEIRTLLNNNVLAPATALSFTTDNFQPPQKEIYPSDAAAGEDIRLAGVKLLAYSTTAVELFWNRLDGAQTSVEVIHNHQSLGWFDSASIFLNNLDEEIDHVFQIIPFVQESSTLESYSVFFNGASFNGQVLSVSASRQINADFIVTSPIEESADTDTESQASDLQGVDAANDSVEEDVSAPVSEPDILAVESPVEPEEVIAPPPPQNDYPAPSNIAPLAAGDCAVHSVANLIDCVNAAQAFDRINVQSDLRCSNGNCCPTGGALVRLNNVSGLTIEGNGFRLLREDGQRQCSLIDVTQSKNLSFKNWILDDDVRDAPCVVADKCPRMLHLRTSSNLTFDEVVVSHGKGYAVYVQEVNGFTFRHSTLENSGVLGMYIGHDEKSSTNINIEHSTFIDNQTNALALLGVTGSSSSTNTISNNVFRRNHWRGQWQVAPRFGTGFTGGGQVYIAQATGVTIKNNLIADGFCENCFVQQRMGTGVSGIELAIPGRNSVNNLLIEDNVVENHDAWGIFVNEGSELNSSIVIRGNSLIDNTIGLKPSAASTASVSSNTIRNR